METIGAFIMCAACQGGVLFSTDPDKQPEKIYKSEFPYAISEMFVGKEAACHRCGKMNIAFINYHSLPPMLVTKVVGTTTELEH